MPESTSVEQRVRERAAGLCEYCRLPQAVYLLPFQIDHVIARQHGGKSQFNNLALACPRCNRNKGPNIAGVDPVSRKIGPLFHPRRDLWSDHFRWRGPRLIGLTQVGRTTIRVLGINQPEALRIRRELMAEGRPPPR
jgi:HNH endonuclease